MENDRRRHLTSVTGLHTCTCTYTRVHSHMCTYTERTIVFSTPLVKKSIHPPPSLLSRVLGSGLGKNRSLCIYFTLPAPPDVLLESSVRLLVHGADPEAEQMSESSEEG